MRKRNRIQKAAAFLSLILAVSILILNGSVAYADAPYKTYTVDGYGSVTETQTAYLPYETITKVGDETLLTPADFTIAAGKIYILDSGNKRVVVSDMEGGLIKTFGEGTLVNPRGIYVTEDETVYVADRDAHAVFVFDGDGNLAKTYTKPESAMYGETLDFLPTKVVANDTGTVYIVCESNTNGIVQISPAEGGTFLGYFGTNATKASLWTIIWRALLTDAQRAKMQSNIPATPDNLAIDDKGVIYTVTRGEKNDTLKRLNIAGVNMIKTMDFPDIPAAVTAGNHDNVFVATQTGFIYEYNNEGDLLFMFGGSDDGKQRIGLSTKVEAIQVGTDDKVYLLDSEMAQIQVFEPTEFTSYLHEALYLFSKGRYEESKEPLSRVIEMNNLFTYANMAMGKALYKEGDYEGALKFAKIAKDKELFSDSYWEIRNIWLRKHLSAIAVLIIILVIAVNALRILDRKKNILARPKAFLRRLGERKLIKETGYMFFFMRHPIDGSYGIKREGRVSVLSANILLIFGILFYVINKYLCGFLTKTVREGSFDVISDVGLILVALLLIVSCNYLMCTINEGEGRFKHIYCAFIYAFAPYLVLMPFLFLLSHAVTNNEIFFVQFGRFCMWVWIAVLVFVGVREINNYKIMETVKIILLTLFTILIVALLGFIIYVLWSQVFDFLQAIFGEVVYRIGS